MDILLGQLIKDLKDEYEIVNISYGYGIAMAIAKMFNDDVRYIYNYYYKDDGTIEKNCVLVDMKLLENVM